VVKLKNVLAIYMLVTLLIAGCSANEQQNAVVVQKNPSNEHSDENSEVVRLTAHYMQVSMVIMRMMKSI
jgi:PBP1b-binding outer membrane lipoprotein LpoB